jgi:hypothetical protein
VGGLGGKVEDRLEFVLHRRLDADPLCSAVSHRGNGIDVVGVKRHAAPRFAVRRDGRATGRRSRSSAVGGTAPPPSDRSRVDHLGGRSDASSAGTAQSWRHAACLHRRRR